VTTLQVGSGAASKPRPGPDRSPPLHLTGGGKDEGTTAPATSSHRGGHRRVKWLRRAESQVPLLRHRARQGKGALVKLSLVPKEQGYFRLFQELAVNLDKAAQLLVRFMEDGDKKSLAASILEHEHVGDKIVHDVVKRLNKSFITPIDREDIYELVATIDEVLDNIEAAADAMVLYRVGEPTAQAKAQAKVIAQATPILVECMEQLEKPQDIAERIIAINSLENDGDRIHRDAVAQLFDGEMVCTDIIKWKDIYELLEAAIDECEHVANVIESIVLKHN
jgi:predicted phosphate transport protein (TIGR00153 family)